MTEPTISWDYADRAGAARVLETLARWASADGLADPLHLGDVGWHLRFEDDVISRTLLVWSDQDGPGAVGLLDATVLRMALGPRLAYRVVVTAGRSSTRPARRWPPRRLRRSRS